MVAVPPVLPPHGTWPWAGHRAADSEASGSSMPGTAGIFAGRFVLLLGFLYFFLFFFFLPCKSQKIIFSRYQKDPTPSPTGERDTSLSLITKSSIILIPVLPKLRCVFFPAFFQGFLSLVFYSLNMICLGVLLSVLVFILLVTLLAS